jgi:hypothetical protein
MAPKVKLVYFSVQGKGEIIRLVLHAGKVRKHRLNMELDLQSLLRLLIG